jgi:hypothetical protein
MIMKIIGFSTALALIIAPGVAIASQPVELIIDQVEITQGLQTSGNVVPLIRGKPTVIRVFPKINTLSAAAPVAGVSAKLRAFRDDVELPGSPISPDNGPIEVRAGDVDRGQVDNSLNFTLVPDWYAQDTAFSAELVLPAGVGDPGPDSKMDVFGHYIPRLGMSIRYVMVHYTNEAWTGARQPRARVADQSAANFLRSIYPADPTMITYEPWSPVEITFDNPINELSKPTISGFALITELNTLFATAANPPDRLFAWTPELAFSGNGLADARWQGGGHHGRVALGNDTGGTDITSRWRRTFAHEVGHNTDGCGLKHPFPPRRLMDDEFGYDVLRIDPFNRIVMRKYPSPSQPPDDLLDFMVADEIEAHAWITPPHYMALFCSLTPPDPFPSQAASVRVASTDSARPAEVLVVRGSVTRVGGGQFFPFYRIPVSGANSALSDATPRGGSHEVRFFSGDREVRGARIGWTPNFRLDRDSPSDILPEQPFTWFVAPVDGATRVELLVNGRVVDTLIVASVVPRVENLRVVTTAPGAVRATGRQARPVTLSWGAPASFRANSVSLVHQVYYTCDDGKTLRLVASGLTQPQAVIDVSSLPGGANCRFQVRTSDGYNVSILEGTSFSNATPSAQVHIIAPTSGVIFPKGAGVLLIGRGYDDAQQIKVEPTQLEWVSDRQGVLGSGEKIVVRSLEQGQHTITLKIKDKDAETSSVAVEIKAR